MIQKKQLLSVNYAIVNYEQASDHLIEKAKTRTSYGVSALAVHGLIESYWDRTLSEQVNKIPLVVADGQPIRWALNSIYGTGMKDRVYGPTLTLHVLEKANRDHLNVYLYGSTASTLKQFQAFIHKTYPNVHICGVHQDRFRDATAEEDLEDIEKINASGAHVVLVGRGCPRQEKWVADHLGKVNAMMMAVGAAFDFHAGTQKQAPKWMQDNGLEWFFRLTQEPKRLWKRYLTTNSTFVYLFLRQKFFA
ncbi:WecB/TagA/CpsF family glycosyltransferase [Persicobacter psychrovividus]|uniref:UDP-N-acetyl-D-mannosaminuronic acid transferase n=1 Tax=Persicobacter psychrovividus TaxID=387638 RepID=A0ABN6LEZ3_9BACT|nr:UDP-N-acetyl-D-mannosaminuronic acid transferase [Persicobacter psychrovividus]